MYKNYLGKIFHKNPELCNNVFLREITTQYLKINNITLPGKKNEEKEIPSNTELPENKNIEDNMNGENVNNPNDQNQNANEVNPQENQAPQNEVNNQGQSNNGDLVVNNPLEVKEPQAENVIGQNTQENQDINTKIEEILQTNNENQNEQNEQNNQNDQNNQSEQNEQEVMQVNQGENLENTNKANEVNTNEITNQIDNETKAQKEKHEEDMLINATITENLEAINREKEIRENQNLDIDQINPQYNEFHSMDNDTENLEEQIRQNREETQKIIQEIEQIHQLNQENEPMESNKLKADLIQYGTIDQIFAKYLLEVNMECCRDYFDFITKFIILFRECINKMRDNNETPEEYSVSHNADNVPDSCNEFITDFMESFDYFGLDTMELIEIIQHLCNWLYENKFTTSKLSLVS